MQTQENKHKSELINALEKIATMADRAIGCAAHEMDDYLAEIADFAQETIREYTKNNASNSRT